MIPQGVVGLVFAVIGSTNGILDKPLEVSIIIMVILTTFLAPPFLRVASGSSTNPIPETTTAVETASE
jgi:hypothetical protein